MPDKPRERWYLEALRQARPELPPGPPEEMEPPDFVFADGGRRVGVELTVFHLPPSAGQRPHQEQQSLKDHIVALAERMHAEAGGPPLYVGVYFNSQHVLTKRDFEPLSRAIELSVLETPFPQPMSHPVEIAWGRRPPQTYGIQIHASVDGRDKLWHADAGGWVAPIEAKHIADILNTKARTAPSARSKCDVLWLVIVHDMFSRAAPSELTAAAAESEYSGPFDRLIWLDPHHPARSLDLKLGAEAA